MTTGNHEPAAISPSIRELSDDLVAAYSTHYPEMATFAGVPGRHNAWGDRSPDGAAAWDAVLAAFEARTASLPSLGLDGRWDKLAKGVIAEFIQQHRDGFVHRDHLVDLNSIDSAFQYLRGVFDVMDTSSEQGFLDIAERLETIDRATASYRASLEEGRSRKHVVARRQARAVAEQARVAAGAASFTHALLATAHRSSVVGETLRSRLDRAAEQARKAFGDLADYLEGTYHASALESDPVGRERYLRASRRFLGMTIDPEETYAWGWEEVRSIEARMARLATEILPGASLTETIAMLETDPARAAGSVDAFLDIMRERQDRALTALSGAHFEVPAPIRRVDVKLAPKGGSLGAYYIPPNEDFSRPGTIWYSPGERTTFPLWGEITTAYHEGFPGHHLQCGLQVYLAERLTRLHRLLVMYPGHAEGWALYAEGLMEELGFFERPEYVLGMLSGKLMRACRVVVDIGLHLDLAIPKDESFHPGERWNHALAADFITERGFLPRDHAISEATRYLGWPGQAISYKVGERVILELRDEARRVHGASFDRRSFHDAIIGSGSIGLERLRMLVAEG